MSLRAGFHGTVGQPSAQVIDGSLRFDSSKTQYLKRTPGSAGNRKTWTMSWWQKRNSLGVRQFVFEAGNADTTEGRFMVRFSGTSESQLMATRGQAADRLTNAIYRDFSGWAHYVVAVDTTAGGNDKIKIYKDGTQIEIGDFSSPTNPGDSADTAVNMAAQHTIGYTHIDSSHPLNSQISQYYLIDGQALDASYFGFTDGLTGTWRPKKYIPIATAPNTPNTVWSSMCSGTEYNSTYSYEKAFDGDTNTVSFASNGNTITFTPTGGITNSGNIVVTFDNGSVTDGGGSADFQINGSSVKSFFQTAITAAGGGSGSSRVATITGITNITSMSWSRVADNDLFGVRKIVVDGVTLVDAQGWGLNGFYLPMDGNSLIGQDKSGRGNDWTPVNFGGSVELDKATGALPILNTTQGGSQAGVGVRTDAYANNLVLALPLVGNTDDISNQINSGSTTKTTSDTRTHSSYGNFYSGSAIFTNNAKNDKVDYSGDLTLGTNDFTLEFWMYRVGNGSQTDFETIVDTRTTDNNTVGFSFGVNSGGSIKTYGIPSGTGSVSHGSGNNTGWNHFALVRGGGEFRIYQNGILVHTSSAGSSNYSQGAFRLGCANASVGSGDWNYNGYLQDLRVYRGIAKYTSNFVPASTSPDILPDTPSGVSGGSKLTKIIDGAVTFDGSSDYLSLPHEASTYEWWDTPFTLEYYVYPNAFGAGANSATNMVGKSDPDSNPESWSFGAKANGTVEWYYWTGSIQRLTTTNTMSLKKWTHLAFTHDGSNGMKIFIDGKVAASGTISGTPAALSTSLSFNIGKNANSAFNGMISNLRMVRGTALYSTDFTPPTAPLTNVTNTKLLTCQENQFKILTDTTNATGGNSIQNTNNSGTTSTTGNRTDSNSSSLVLAVPFNGSTDDICDEIGSNTAKAATLTNSPSSENIGHFYGKSYKFTGADGQRIDYAASADFNFGTGAFTVEGWYYHLEKTSANFDRRYFVHNETNWESGRWIIYCGYTGNPNRAVFYTYDTYTANGNNPFLTGKTTFAVGNWYHIAVTRSSNTFRLFVNGRLEDQDDDSNSVGNSTVNIFVGGASVQTDRTLFGHIQDLRIYKGVAKYTAPFIPPRVPTYDSAVTPSSNIIGLAGGESLPTNFNPFNTDVHTVRGQETGYATLNPLSKSSGTTFTLSDGNLTLNAEDVGMEATLRASTGKFYFETKLIDWHSNGGFVCGLGAGRVPERGGNGGANLYYPAYTGYDFTSGVRIGTADSTMGVYSLGTQTLVKNSGWALGDLIGIAVDCDRKKLQVYHNGAKLGGECDLPSGESEFSFYAFVQGGGGDPSEIEVNFGQKPFKFPPPDGFQPLNAANVRPETVIARPDKFFNITEWSGDNTDPRQINLGMAPDLIWVKTRNQTNWHWLSDSLRGTADKRYKLYANEPSAEDTAPIYGQADSINDFGFVAGGGTDPVDSLSDSNKTGTNYICWSWKAGGSNFTYNKDGSGGSSASDIGVSATTLTLTGATINTRSKFGIYTYTGSGSGGATLNHGLEGTPGLVIYKKRTGSSSWQVYHQSLGGTVYNTLDEDVGDYTSDSTRFGGTNPTASTISLGTHANGAGPVVLYAWCDVPGLQKFGSWTGINSTDGNFVELGFRPALVIAKETSATGAGAQWFMLDSSRNTYNPLNNILDANRENIERQAVIYDFLSNGFKIRTTFNSGATFIYMAWAEAPTFNLYGGQSNAR